jgi:hypothetical protein
MFSTHFGTFDLKAIFIIKIMNFEMCFYQKLFILMW